MTRCKSSLFTSVFLIGSLFLIGNAAAATDSDLKQSILENRYAAQDIVAKAFEAEGSDAYEDVSKLYMHLERKLFTDRRAAKHDASWRDQPIVDDIYLFWDFENHRFRGYQIRQDHGGLVAASETLYIDETAYSIAPSTRTFREHKAPLDTYNGYVGHPYHAWLAIIRPLAPFLWSQMRSGVSYIGETRIRGEEVDIIEVPWPASPRRPRHYISKESGKVFLSSSYFPDALDGDISNLVWPQGRKKINGLPVPEEIHVDYTAGWTEIRTIKDIRQIDEFPEGVFDLDSDLQPAEPRFQHFDVSNHVKSVANIGGGRSIHYVAFDDFNFVIDTPSSPSAARRLIDIIQEETGNPVKYLALTHGHLPNIGGVREFAKDGATIITSEAAAPLVTRFLAAPGSRLAGNQNRAPIDASAKIEFATQEKPFRIDVNEGRILVHNMGDTPHAEDMLLVQLARENIVIGGDLYSSQNLQSETLEYVVKWIDENGFDNPVILNSVNGPRTLNELKDSESQLPAYPRYLEQFIK